MPTQLVTIAKERMLFIVLASLIIKVTLREIKLFNKNIYDIKTRTHKTEHSDTIAKFKNALVSCETLQNFSKQYFSCKLNVITNTVKYQV